MSIRHVQFPVTLLDNPATFNQYRFYLLVVRNNNINDVVLNWSVNESVPYAQIPKTYDYYIEVNDTIPATYTMYTYMVRDDGAENLKASAVTSWVIPDTLDTITVTHRVNNVHLLKAATLANPTNKYASVGSDLLAPNIFSVWDSQYSDPTGNRNDLPIDLYFYWINNAVGDTSHKVFEAPLTGSYAQLLNAVGANASDAYTYGHARGTFKFYVSAYKSSTNTYSPPSNIIQFQTGQSMPKPATINVASVTADIVRIVWENPTDLSYLDAYLAYAMNDNFSPTTDGVLFVPSDPYYDLDLTPLGITQSDNLAQVFIQSVNLYGNPVGQRNGFYSNAVLIGDI